MTHLLDTQLAVRNTAIRKGIAYTLLAYRRAYRPFVSAEEYLSKPPVVVNSIPKSGTHLLLQVARALPACTYYGAFINWASSLTLHPRSPSQIDSMLLGLVPGEIAGAHLYYTNRSSAVLARQNIVHWFIVRDPIDIVLSEVHYLRSMNWRHRMAREFRHLNQQEAITLCLNGSGKRPDLYPNFEARLRPYIDWLSDASVTQVRYEDLMGAETRKREIRRLVTGWMQQVAGFKEADINRIVDRANQAIAPERSHTYSGREKSRDEEARAALAVPLADLRRRCGYHPADC